MSHLQGLASFDEDTILGSHPGAHHNCCGCGQPQGARAGDAEHSDGRLEGKSDDHLCPRDMLVRVLWRRETSDGAFREESHTQTVTEGGGGAVGTENATSGV